MLGKRPVTFSQLMLYVLITTLFAACSPATLPQLLSDPDLLYQTSTLSALGAGDFDGSVTMEMLLAHGDFGLGTFDALDGEMIVLDGQIYQVREDGSPTLADASVETPFAAVTSFGVDQTLVVSKAVDCPELQAQIDSQLPTLDAPYAIKVSGEFTTLQVRAPRTQQEPYPTLTEALADQVVFDLQNISGTLVGFRLPDYLAGANAAGYHFHFISDDRAHGGHVLACEAEALTVQIDTTDRIFIDVTPSTEEPQQAAALYNHGRR